MRKKCSNLTFDQSDSTYKIGLSFHEKKNYNKNCTFVTFSYINRKPFFFWIICFGAAAIKYTHVENECLSIWAVSKQTTIRRVDYWTHLFFSSWSLQFTDLDSMPIKLPTHALIFAQFCVWITADFEIFEFDVWKSAGWCCEFNGLCPKLIDFSD